ncbi:hypothetical protein JCM5296_005284 [Sporobolomyces johnsonii]
MSTVEALESLFSHLTVSQPSPPDSLQLQVASSPPSLTPSSESVQSDTTGELAQADYDARGTPWMAELGRTDRDRARSPPDLIDEEIEAFSRWIRPSRREHELRLQALTCFRKVVTRLWPTASIQQFGSMSTGLYLPNGDFDVVIQDTSLVRYPTPSVLNALSTALINSGFTTRTAVRLVSSARVPLVKFTSTPQFGSFRFDISFNGTKGPKGAEQSLRLLKELEGRGEERKARARAIVMLFKCMLAAQELNEVKNGGLGGLSAFCMGVWWMQMDERPMNGFSVSNDFLSFLQKFAISFDYRRHAICTANGGCTLSKSVKRWLLDRDPDRLSIQHPVDPERDLSSGSYNYERVREVLIDAYARLAPLLRSSTRPTSPSDFDPTLGVLGDIGIRVSLDVIDARRANEELMRSGALEELERSWKPEIGEVRLGGMGRMSGRNGASEPQSVLARNGASIPTNVLARNGASMTPSMVTQNGASRFPTPSPYPAVSSRQSHASSPLPFPPLVTSPLPGPQSQYRYSYPYPQYASSPPSTSNGYLPTPTPYPTSLTSSPPSRTPIQPLNHSAYAARSPYDWATSPAYRAATFAQAQNGFSLPPRATPPRPHSLEGSPLSYTNAVPLPQSDRRTGQQPGYPDPPSLSPLSHSNASSTPSSTHLQKSPPCLTSTSSLQDLAPPQQQHLFMAGAPSIWTP